MVALISSVESYCNAVERSGVKKMMQTISPGDFKALLDLVLDSSNLEFIHVVQMTQFWVSCLPLPPTHSLSWDTSISVCLIFFFSEHSNEVSAGPCAHGFLGSATEIQWLEPNEPTEEEATDLHKIWACCQLPFPRTGLSMASESTIYTKL